MWKCLPRWLAVRRDSIRWLWILSRLIFMKVFFFWGETLLFSRELKVKTHHIIWFLTSHFPTPEKHHSGSRSGISPFAPHWHLNLHLQDIISIPIISFLPPFFLVWAMPSCWQTIYACHGSLSFQTPFLNLKNKSAFPTPCPVLVTSPASVLLSLIH